MRRVEAILAAVMAITLTGCVLGGKPQTANAVPVAPKPAAATAPEPSPQNLSIPQTHVELPPPQPLSPEALATTQPPEETPNTPPPASTRQRRTSRPPANSPAAEPVGPAPQPTPPPPQPQPAESGRPAIHEIVPEAELIRLRTEAIKMKAEIQQRLQQFEKHRLNRQEKDLEHRILSFVEVSNQAESQGDMRKAYDQAARGLALAQGLVDAK